jgi:hypothetical protein
MELNDFDASLFVGANSDPTTEVVEDTPNITADVVVEDVPTTTVVEPVEPAAPTTTTIVPELDAVEFENLTPREKRFLEQLEQLRGERLEQPATIAPAVQSTTAVADVTADSHDFLAGLDIDEVLSSAESLNKLLNVVYSRALEQGTRLATENVLRSTPQAISQFVTQHMTMREMVDDFYKNNPALAAVKRTVASVANEIALEKPELKLEELFKEAGEKVHKMLGLKKGVQQAPTTTRGRTALLTPRGNNGRVQAPALQGLSGEISELFDIH